MGLPNIGPVELIIVLVIALLVLGPGKLPEVGSAFGKTIREFKKASSDITESTSLTAAPAPAAPAAPSVPVAAMPAPNTLTQTPAPNTLSDLSEPALKGTPADPVADRA
jgi:sec-independent protein translocase protein TatA